MNKLLSIIIILACIGCREIKEGHEQRQWNKEVTAIQETRKALKRPCAYPFCDKELPPDRYTFHVGCPPKDDPWAMHYIYVDCEWCKRDCLYYSHLDCPNQDDKDKYWTDKEKEWKQNALRAKALEWIAIQEKVAEIQKENDK